MHRWRRPEAGGVAPVPVEDAAIGRGVEGAIDDDSEAPPGREGDSGSALNGDGRGSSGGHALSAAAPQVGPPLPSLPTPPPPPPLDPYASSTAFAYCLRLRRLLLLVPPSLTAREGAPEV